MNPQDTGNLFLLKENSSMDEATKALCKDEWKLAKQQLRDTVVAPYLLFNPDVSGLDYDGFKTASENLLEALMAYELGSSKTFEEHAAELNAAFKSSDAYINFADNSGAVALAEETTVDETTAADETTAEDETTGDETTESAPEEPAEPDRVLVQYESWCAANKIK